MASSVDPVGGSRVGRLMAQVRSDQGWGAVAAKYGLPWVLLAYMLYSQQTGFVRTLDDMRLEHAELAFYLRAVCLGVNRDQPGVCQPTR